MDRVHSSLYKSLAVVALVVGACTTSQSAPTSTPVPTAATGAAATAGSASPSPTFVDETPAALPSDAPEPTPTPASTLESTPTPSAASTVALKPPTGWTASRQVGTATQCISVTAGIDAAGRFHVAAECSGSIRYYFSSDGGRSWTARVFAHAANRDELDPRIGFQGNVVYVAYTRIIPDGGCSGTRGEPVGVFFRSRTLPNGAWSASTQIGSAGDTLGSFQVDRGILHAAVTARDLSSYYVKVDGTVAHRYLISHSSMSAPSLRIGSDGHARIAYATWRDGIRYGVFTGSAFATSKVTGSIEEDDDPVLALDAANHAHVVWTRYEPAACGRFPVGTYHASNASGAWKAERITKDVGDTSIQVDGKTGRIHVLVGSQAGLRYFTAAPGGTWTRTTVASTKDVISPALRLDPATGKLLGVYIDPFETSRRIYSFTTT